MARTTPAAPGAGGGGAILLLDALFLGLLFGGGSAGATASRIPPVNRSISAVLLGTFTLRFSTGLTGGLLVYYLDALPEYGGVEVASTTVGILTATYFLAELVLSRLRVPVGSLRRAPDHADRPDFRSGGSPDHRRHGEPVDHWRHAPAGGRRGGGSIPSILGYIALATSGDQSIRGRAVSRFEAATLLGIGFGIVAAGQSSPSAASAS